MDLEAPPPRSPSPFAGELGTDEVEKASEKSGAGIDKLGRLSSLLDLTRCRRYTTSTCAMLHTTWWGSLERNSRDRYTLSYTEPATLGKAEDNLLMEDKDPVLLLAERPTRSSAGELLLD